MADIAASTEDDYGERSWPNADIVGKHNAGVDRGDRLVGIVAGARAGAANFGLSEYRLRCPASDRST